MAQAVRKSPRRKLPESLDHEESRLSPESSPRDVRLQKRGRLEQTSLQRLSLDFNSIDKCSSREVRRLDSLGSIFEARSREPRTDVDLRLAETLQRGGLVVPLSAGAPLSSHYKSDHSFLIQRPPSSAGQSSSSDAKCATGVADVDNGRHSRLSGRALHSRAKMQRTASSSSMAAIGGRASSLRASIAGSAASFVGSSSGSFKALRDIDTPPGAADAFEASKALVLCPPPLRPQVHATRAERADFANFNPFGHASALW